MPRIQLSKMSAPKNITIYLHTSKMEDPDYEKTFRMMTEALVTDKANFVVLMNAQGMTHREMHCGVSSKEKILSVAEGLFKIYKEDNEKLSNPFW